MSPKPPPKPGKGGPKKKGPKKPPRAGLDMGRLAEMRGTPEERRARERRRSTVGKGIGADAKIEAYEAAQRAKAAAAKKREAREAAEGKPKEPGKPRGAMPDKIKDLTHWQLKSLMKNPERHGLVRRILPHLQTLAKAPGQGKIKLREGLVVIKTPGRKLLDGGHTHSLYEVAYTYPSLVLRRPITKRVLISHEGNIVKL